MPPTFNKSWNTEEHDYLVVSMRALKETANEGDENFCALLRNNVANALTQVEEDGSTKFYFNERPVEAMSNNAWYEQGIPNTMLENVTDATDNQKAFVRQVAYESNGNKNDILNEETYIHGVLVHCTDDNRSLRLNMIPTAIGLAWDDMYAGETLHPVIYEWAYNVTVSAFMDWVDN